MGMMETGIPVTYDVNTRNDGWGNGSFIWVFLIFAMMMWGGNGFFGGNNSGLNQVTNDFLFTNLNSKLDSNFGQLVNQQFASQKDGWQQSQDMQMALARNGFITQNNTKDLQMQLAQNAFQARQCCCETQKAIAAMQAENYKNTCAITSAIQADGQATRAVQTAMQIQDLRDRLAERDRQVMSAQIINSLSPKAPIPAYIVASPFATTATATTA